MRIRHCIIPGLLGFLAFMAGCTGSVGCGNPPSYSEACPDTLTVADLDPTDVNICQGRECGGGAIGPTPYRVTIGKTLSLRLAFQAGADTSAIRFYMYGAHQIPALQPAPLDSFFLTSGSEFHLNSRDMEKIVRNVPDEDLFLLNIFIRYVPVPSEPTWVQEGLVAGLGWDVKGGRFIAAAHPSWKKDSGDFLRFKSSYFQGKVVSNSIEAGLSTASRAYVYIPGSPYYTTLGLQDSLFRLDEVTDTQYELRMVAIPADIPVNSKNPVFLLKSQAGSGIDRPFTIIDTVDSVTISPESP